MMQHTIRHLRTQYNKQIIYHGQLASGFRPWQKNYSTEAKPGVMGSLRNAYDTASASREEQTKKKIFQAQMKYLSSPEPMTPQVFLGLLDEIKVAAGVGGMKKHLPWVANNEAMKDFEQQEAIIKALTPDEQRSARPQRISVKKRVARTTGTDLLTVESLLTQISNLRYAQRKVRGRIDRGEKLPKSPEELRGMAGSGGGGRTSFPKPGVKQKRNQPRW